VSWGTKGSDKAEALPSVASKKGKEDQPAMVEDVTKVQEDVDAQFKETVQRAVTKVKSEEATEKPTVDVSVDPLRWSMVYLQQT
jgi:chitin synthase